MMRVFWPLNSFLDRDGKARSVSAIFIAQEILPSAPLSQKTKIGVRRCTTVGIVERVGGNGPRQNWSLGVEFWPSKDQLVLIDIKGVVVGDYLPSASEG